MLPPPRIIIIIVTDEQQLVHFACFNSLVISKVWLTKNPFCNELDFIFDNRLWWRNGRSGI